MVLLAFGVEREEVVYILQKLEIMNNNYTDCQLFSSAKLII
jgi:hypothetical protein